MSEIAYLCLDVDHDIGHKHEKCTYPKRHPKNAGKSHLTPNLRLCELWCLKTKKNRKILKKFYLNFFPGRLHFLLYEKDTIFPVRFMLSKGLHTI